MHLIGVIEGLQHMRKRDKLEVQSQVTQTMMRSEQEIENISLNGMMQDQEDVTKRDAEQKRENDIVEPNELFAISVMTRKVAIAGRAYVEWVLVKRKR